MTSPDTAADHIPLVLDMIGGLIQQPNGGGQDARFEHLARLLAEGTARQRWHLIDTALTVTETLGDAYRDMTGATGITYLDTGSVEIPGDDTSQAVVRGAQDAVQVLRAHSDPARAAFAARHTGGQAPAEEAFGAAVMLCYCGYTTVTAIAGVARTPLRKTWKKILPILLEP